MAKKKAAAAKTPAKPAAPAGSRSPHAAAVLILAAAVLGFYWEPLFSTAASVQWDAVDVHYSLQKYFADHLREGKLPHWTPYVFSGFPFLADPQVGAWYPLNWPFFLLGISAGALQAELALHTLLAALGAYAFAWRKLGRREPALVVALGYAFSGFFAGHASHIGISQAAAWLGWILLAVDRAVETRAVFWKLVAGLLTGVMVLAGHFQTALYVGFAVACYAIYLVIQDRGRWRQAATAVAMTAAVGLAISAVMVVPGWELLSRSVRASADFRAEDQAFNPALVPSSLLTLVYPNTYGLLDGQYSGPADITQFYFYAGLLTLPLAALGLAHRSTRWPALALLIPAAWYAFGPAGGLYPVLSGLPGLGSVRAPVHMWFVAAFGLALLAGAGAAEALSRWKLPWLAWAIPAVLFCDLYWFNSATNPLTYARNSFAELYGNKLSEFEQRLAARLPPLTRFHAPDSLTAFGPQNHPLDAKAETTYGYNPLRLNAYNDFLLAAGSNPKLLDELGAKFRFHPQTHDVVSTDDALPRVTIPKTVITVAAGEEHTGKLRNLDPRQSAIVTGVRVASQDGTGTASVSEHDEGFYRIRYRVGSPTLIRVAESYFPGWEAEAGGRSLEVLPVDRALLGVVVPAGEGEVALRFRTRGLLLWGALSLLAAGATLALILRSLRSRGRALPTPG